MPYRLRKLLPGLLVSVGFSVWFVWTADWAAVGAALRAVHGGWVALVALALFLEHVVRALRWRVLLRRVVPNAHTAELWEATVIGMSTNVLVPFRMGDFLRPWLVARAHGEPYLMFLTIAAIERVFDILGLMGQVLLLGLLAPADADGVVLSRLNWAALLGGAGFVALLVFMALAARPERSRGWYGRVVGLFPEPVRNRLLDLYEGFSRGLDCVRHPPSLVVAALWSLLHWTNGTLAIWLLCRAFDVNLPFAAACFTNIALAVSVGLPQAPGYLGVFHTAIETALRVWDNDAGFAQAFAVLFWFVSFVPVTTVGLILFLRRGLDFRGVRREMAEVA